MDRRVALTMVTGTLIALILVAIASSDAVPLAQRAPSLPFDLPDFDLTQATPATLAPEPGDSPFGPTTNRSAELRSFLEDVLLLGLIALFAVGVRRAWQNRPELIWRTPRRPDDFVLLEEVAAAMAADAAAQRAALERGEARNAIVACWSRLEQHVADAGFERDPADTTAEFTVRVLSRFDVDPIATADLSALYREARFSTHPMGEPERAVALVALDAIHAGLRDAVDRVDAT